MTSQKRGGATPKPRLARGTESRSEHPRATESSLVQELDVWAEVDLGAIKRNVERIVAFVAPSRVLAVVKADGYGHGGLQAARAALEGGAAWLGVARVGEGEALRDAGITAPVLLLAEPPPAQRRRALQARLTPALYTPEAARDYSAAATGRPVAVHVKIDTGMHRYGLAPPQGKEFFDLLARLEGIEVEGIWTHLAVAEDPGNPMNADQHQAFLDVLEQLGSLGHGLIRHVSNSAAAFNFPEARMDMVRAGISIYGISPFNDGQDPVTLEPALSLKSRVSLVKRLPAGEALSYGAHYRLANDAFVVTVPCGYADGLPRALGGRGEVLIRGKRHKISGTITMDHFLVDAGDDEVESGDEVVVIGRQGDDCISAHEVASNLGTIPYEVVCGISARVPRIY